MAEDLVKTALSNLKSLYEDEAKLFQLVNQERKKLQSKLSTIQSVLQDAEKKQLAEKSNALNDWLLKLKDAVYELDDILDDCTTEDIRDEYEGDRSCAFLGFLHPQKVMFRHNIIGRMKAIRERLDVIAQEKDQFNFLPAESRPDTNLSNIPAWRETKYFVTEDEVIGRDQDKQIIVRHLLEDARNSDSLYVYPVLGLAGLGKTTLAQLVYNDERVTEHFEKKWVCVSENFDLKKLLKAITKSDESCDDLEALVEKLQGMLKGKRYLIVLDDVWNENPDKWMELRRLLACGAKGSAVLVTTRLETVAMMMRTPSAQPYQLSLLSEDDCWQVFRNRAFGFSIVGETQNLVSIGKDIARKCKGVPLAAKALGGLLMSEADERFWIKTRDSDLWTILPEVEGSIFAALRLSYINLSPRSRRCFSFCSIFPKDHIILKMDLIHLWMANGLISQELSTKWELEDIGEMVVNDLYRRSLIQDIKRDDDSRSILYFKMHDLVHDLAQSVSNHESDAMEEQCSADFSPGIRHLSIAYHGRELHNTSNLLEKIESLRSLVFLSCGGPVDLAISHAIKHPKLRAFVCSGAYTNMKKLPSSIAVLKHLRYLNLSGSSITELPDSIGSLWNLQTLDVRFCPLYTFPVSIGRLKNLRHLYNGQSDISKMPQSMVGLTSLRTLNLVVVGEHEKQEFQLSDLEHMKYLRGEIEIKNLERVRDAKDVEKVNLKEKDLHGLYLSWCNENGVGVADQQKQQMHILEALRPSPRLRYLWLEGYKGMSFSNWLMNELPSFQYIKSLTLVNCQNCKRLPPLWRLPSLKELALYELSNMRYLFESLEDCCGEECVSFPTLESLSIKDFRWLGTIMSGEEADQQFKNGTIFPRLSELVIWSCPRLKSFNAGPLPSLRSLEFRDNDRIMLSMLSSASYNLQSLHSLKKLTISCDSLESFPDQMFQGMSSLQDLRIESCSKLKSLPESIKSLCSLELLIIYHCWELKDITPILRLTSLRKIRLRGLFMKSLETDTSTDLSSLKSLKLGIFPELEFLPSWMIELVSLMELELDSCPLLTTLPNGIQKLSKLENLYIMQCPGLEQPCEKETGQDWHKIAHIPNILITRNVIF